MWSTTTLISKWLPHFETLQEPCLKQALEQMALFMGRILSREKPYWLSLCGHSGTGKTTLAKAFGTFMRQRGQFHTDDSAYQSGAQLVRQWSWWGEDELVRELRDGNFQLVDDLSWQWLVVIDDIGFSNDRTGFATSAIGEILNRRAGKWTLLTSNLGPREWAEKDSRIASRLIRDENQVVKFDCKDYALRTKAAAA